MAFCPYCREGLAPDTKWCPKCERAVPDDLFEGADPNADEASAIYTLERAVRCPVCRAQTSTVRVIRMSRTRVSFTSTLPRGGHVVVCAACDHVLSIEV